jgi:hypothetical protein
MKFVVSGPVFALIGFAAVMVGCTGSGGGGILDRPGGDITVTDATTGKTLATSLANPYLVSSDSLHFAVEVTESHFAGPYTVSIISETNVATASNGGVPYGFTFSEPCFTISENAPITTQAVTLTFAGSNANGQPEAYPVDGVPTPGPSGAPSSQAGNPCHSGELETAQISDSDGHSVNFYYEIYP